MATILMAIGGIFVPLGFYLLIEGGVGWLWYARIAVIIGLICFILAIRKVQSDEKESKEQNKDILRLLTSIERKMGREDAAK